MSDNNANRDLSVWTLQLDMYGICEAKYDFAIIEKGHRFGLDLDMFWSCFGFNLESVLVSVWI